MNQAPTAAASRATIQPGGESATAIEIPEHGATRDETRARRSAKSVDTLHAGRT